METKMTYSIVSQNLSDIDPDIVLITRNRFWNFVDILDNNSCWNWKGSLTRIGYGQCGAFGRMWSVHRLSWLLTYGSISDSHILHNCDNRRCANPSHLHEGTHQDNMREMAERGRRKPGGNHKLTKNQIATIRIRIKNSIHYRLICKEFNISKSQFYRIKSGEQCKE